MKKKEIKLNEVQRAFSHAIIRRDQCCKIRDFLPCSGRLECSHFFTKGSTPALMFYPYNAFAQCTQHHFRHHNAKEDKNLYQEWMAEHHPEELAYMETVKNSFIKYTYDVKREIITYCNNDDLEGLRNYLRGIL